MPQTKRSMTGPCFCLNLFRMLWFSHLTFTLHLSSENGIIGKGQILALLYISENVNMFSYCCYYLLICKEYILIHIYSLSWYKIYNHIMHIWYLQAKTFLKYSYDSRRHYAYKYGFYFYFFFHFSFSVFIFAFYFNDFNFFSSLCMLCTSSVEFFPSSWFRA